MSISIDEKVFKSLMGRIDVAQTLIETEITKDEKNTELVAIRDSIVYLRNDFQFEFITMKPSAVLGIIDPSK